MGKYVYSGSERRTDTGDVFLNFLLFVMMGFLVIGILFAIREFIKPEQPRPTPFCETVVGRDDPRCAGWYTSRCYR